MKKHCTPKKSALKQKLAAALSVVNALNACAPVALPYVSVTQSLSTGGGQIKPLSDNLFGAFYGTAQAEPVSQSIGLGETAAWDGGTMYGDQDEQSITGGTGTVDIMSAGGQKVSGYTSGGIAVSGTGTVDTMSGGTQIIYKGGKGTVDTMNGGVQAVDSGGAGTVITMNGGAQNVSSGGSGIITNFNGGTQIVLDGGTATVSAMGRGVQNVKDGGNGTVITMNNGGDQWVSSGGTGMITTMSGGWQYVSNGGTGTVTTMSGGWQYVSNGGTGTVTTMSGGRQEVSTGGNGTVTTMNDGMQFVNSYGTGTVETMSGGMQVVADGGTGTVTTMSGGTQDVWEGGTVKVTTMNGGTQRVRGSGTGTVISLNSGGTQIVHGGGTSKDTIVVSGGVMEENGNGAIVINAQFVSGGTHRIVNGAAKSGMSVSGHILEVGSGGTATNTTVNSGGVQNALSGGIAANTTVNSDGVQNALRGGTAANTTVNSGGVQNALSGGTAANTTVYSGGTQNVLSGGIASGGTVSGGTQHIFSGGTAVGSMLSGGTITVEEYAAAQIDNAESGILKLSDLGLAEVQFGTLNVPASVFNHNLTTLYARGDNVRLGLGDESNHSVANNKLHIEDMDGYANFIVNTDLRNNQSDLIEIVTAENATKPNTVQINHDPTLAKGEEITSANAKVATVENGTAVFVGVESTINSIDYMPEIETIDGGKTWVIRRVRKSANDAAHNAVMGSVAGMTALSTGNDFIGAAIEGISMTENEGTDGVAAFAKMGGGAVRQETGSHVDVKTWNAILALGHQNKKERGTFEYGAFFEYGSGSYTTHNGSLRGDGSVRSTGGGVLAKWTDAHGLYVEGSLRAGTLNDDARDVLKDNSGKGYGYETDADYFGAHIGVGREILLSNGNIVDVYGKYFYNRKNSVSFNANSSHFDLDSVTSRVLRVGARYTVKREKWSFYGGAAYEHEFDGVAGGTVEDLPIRSADIKGSSFRAEIGATMKPDENSPWKLDLNVAGFAGKKQGFSGGVSVTFMF